MQFTQTKCIQIQTQYRLPLDGLQIPCTFQQQEVPNLWTDSADKHSAMPISLRNAGSRFHSRPKVTTAGHQHVCTEAQYYNTITAVSTQQLVYMKQYVQYMKEPISRYSLVTALCSQVGVYQHFGGTHCLHLQSLKLSAVRMSALAYSTNCHCFEHLTPSLHVKDATLQVTFSSAGLTILKLNLNMDNNIDITRKDDYSISPIINGLSDHDTQSITLNKININLHAKQFKIIREINKHTIGDFLIKVSYETWDQIFSSENVN
jgi:hypothetical protein